MTAYPIQSSFARGELSKRLHARVDIEHYRSGLATCFNATIMRQGGWRRRPGTYFVAEAKTASGNVIVREFVFSSAQAYVIELGDLYARFYANQGQVQSGGLPYEIVTPWDEADLPGLKFTQFNDVVYVTHKNYAPRKLQRFGETNWTISEVVFEDGPYLDIIADGTTLTPSGTGNLIPTMSGATTPSGTASASSEDAGYEAWHAFDGDPNTDWQAADPGSGLFEAAATNVYLQYQFSAAKICTGYYVASSNRTASTTVGATTVKVPGSLRAPRSWKLLGSNDGTTWVLLDSRVAITGWGDGERRYFEFSNSTAYAYYRLHIIDINSSETAPLPVSIGEWALSGGGANRSSITLTASSDDPINNGTGFTADDVGRHIRFLDEDANWHWFKITSRSSATVVVADLYSAPLPTVNAALSWRLGAFSEQSGWPACSVLFQGRMFYARTNDNPQSVWGSRSDDFEDFGTSVPLKEDDAISLTIAEAGEILWMVDSGELIVGSTSGIRPIGASDKSKGFSAVNYQQGRKLRVPAADVQPTAAGDAHLMAGQYGNSVHELVYSLDANGIVAPDVSVLSEHIYRNGVSDIAYAPKPDALAWSIIEGGTLAAITYEREQKMVAHHRHAFGGDGEAISICTIPGADRSEVWFVVDRAGGLRTIEYMAADFDSDRDEIADAHYVDCGLLYDGSPATVITGLDHLDGLEVEILADGAPEPAQTVSGGQITLSVEASKVHVGLGYTSTGKTLPIPTGRGDGSGLGRKKVLDHVLLNIMDGMVLQAKGAGSFEYVLLRSTNDNMDEPVPLFEGDKTVKVDDRWGNGGVVEWQVAAPVPCIVRAVTPAYDSEP